MVKRTAKQAGASWRWIQPVPGIPDIGADITAIFKAEGSEPPSALKALFPRFEDSSVTASMFAREAIANSWDAYWSSDHTHQDFELHFRFRTLDLMESGSLRRALDLDTLADRIKSAGSGKGQFRRSLGLRQSDCLSDLTRPIRVLEISERWGGGMGGDWDQGDSAMELALIKVGWAQRRAGAGGSFGYGKAAVAQASKILSVVAYSCFQEDGGDDVTRRLLGATYWKPHEVGNDKYNGWAIFGDHSEPAPRPFEDDEADRVAEQLGFEVRRPGVPEERGSSLLIVDPVFTAEELRASMLCFWWPALLHSGDWRMHLFIAEDDGEPQEVLVDDDDPLLGPFVKGFRAAENRLAADGAELGSGEPVESSGPVVFEITSDEETVAAVGLVPLPAEVTRGMSLVATMRTHRMVINYEDYGSGFPVVRGALIASDEVNESLRMTEPAEHHKWLQRRVGDNRGEQEDYRMAALIISSLRERVSQLKHDLTPIAAARRGWTPGFSGFLGVPGEAKQGRKPKTPGGEEKKSRPKRPIHIRLVHPDDFAEVERPTKRPGTSPETLQAMATVEFAVTDEAPGTEFDVEFILTAHVTEESGRGDLLPIDVVPVNGSTSVDRIEDGLGGTARFRGKLRKGKPKRFTLVTSEYSWEWTVGLAFDAVIASTNSGGQ